VTRDKSLVRFLAEKVLGWRWGGSPSLWRDTDGKCQAWELWNPIENGSDAFRLWRRAQRAGIYVLLCPQGAPEDWDAKVLNTEIEILDNSGTRALSEAIARAYGWKEPE
jgi:hypothetical protein